LVGAWYSACFIFVEEAMTDKKMSLQDVANKCENEGGIWDALSWGIRSKDIADKELAILWKKLEEFAESGIIDEIQDILDESMEEE
jgi:hypothetical protein